MSGIRTNRTYRITSLIRSSVMIIELLTLIIISHITPLISMLFVKNLITELTLVYLVLKVIIVSLNILGMVLCQCRDALLYFVPA